MLSKNSRIVIGAIIALLLIVAAYVVAQPRVSRNQALNSMDTPTATAQSGVSNTETHIGSDGKIVPDPTAVATTQPVPTALPAQKQPLKTKNTKIKNTTTKNTKTIKIVAYKKPPFSEFNFGSSSIDRYCIYKLQETNKNVSIQRHAEYWMDYIATTLEGMHNITEFEHRYNLTHSNCVERLTTNTTNGSVKPVGGAERVSITVE